MASFTNQAFISYNGGSASSNITVGELIETMSAGKTAVISTYGANDQVTYVLSLVNSGANAFNGLTVTDDMGGYTFGEGTVYPLDYREGSIRYYVNGVLQAAPAVSAGPPLIIGGINVPANGNATIIYEARINGYAPLDAEGSVINTATVTGAGLSAPVTATETITPAAGPCLTITKSMSPTTVSENGQLTYTFIIQNYGNAEAVATDNVVLSDTFDPILSGLTVTVNGKAVSEGAGYTYDETTGEFATTIGTITVPAATFTRNAETGEWIAVPGTATVVVTGTV